MKKLALAACVIATSAVGAAAADLPARIYTKAPVAPPAVYNWSGFYVGANGGGGLDHTNWLSTVVGTTANHNSSGGLAGGQIGVNWQTGAWVFGVEADGDWTNISGSTPCPNPAFTCASNTRDLASFRGRLGYANGQMLFYATGGSGYANEHYSTLTTIGGVPAGGSTGFFNDGRWGYAAGAGVEWAFAPNWSVKAEYMHYGFGTDTAPPLTLSTSNPAALRLNVDTVKFGVNYHFNWGGPVVAKY